MKLISLHIKKLYDCYDYDIDFNHDVTFIYGSNGCGKTTILNITEAIITGQLFKLFDYEFKEITLVYADSKNMTQLEKIILKRDLNNILLNYSGDATRIKKTDEYQNKLPNSSYKLRREYYRRYPFLKEIQKKFNYVYLPLNRAVGLNTIDYMIHERNIHRLRIGTDDLSMSRNSDNSIAQVEAIIYNAVNNINSKIATASDNFRNEILKSLIDMKVQSESTSLEKDILKITSDTNKISNIQNEYIKFLKDLDLINKNEEESYIAFFDEIISSFKNASNNNNINYFDLALKYNEILKIDKLLLKSKELEDNKNQIRKPLDTFLNIMNEFLGNSDDNKEIIVTKLGKVYFTTRFNKNRIAIQNLSSGEKQLITFFTHLIFKVKDKVTGIFVVDEPELSLHLSWQRIFVEKTMTLNNNIQLIFATHSPEIIGNRRDNMYKLEKKFIEMESVNNE